MIISLTQQKKIPFTGDTTTVAKNSDDTDGSKWRETKKEEEWAMEIFVCDNLKEMESPGTL